MFGQFLSNKNKTATVFNSESATPIWESKHGPYIYMRETFNGKASKFRVKPFIPLPLPSPLCTPPLFLFSACCCAAPPAAASQAA
jgi:hypothetical protein